MLVFFVYECVRGLVLVCARVRTCVCSGMMGACVIGYCVLIVMVNIIY